MISIVEFIERLTDLTKQNQSGFSSGTDITGKINQCQLELAQYLYSIFEVNQNAVDLMAPITVPFETSTDLNGFAYLPGIYNHLLSLTYVKSPTQRYKCQRIGLNQIDIINKIPQRRPSLEKNRIVYYFVEKRLQILPIQNDLNFEGVIAVYPTEANISYTYTEVDGEPKREIDYTTLVDLDWDKNVYNLLLYMVMDKMGISVRDQLLNEYAALGIARESVKPTN